MRILVLFSLAVILLSCKSEDEVTLPMDPSIMDSTDSTSISNSEILDLLASNYEQMLEKEIAVSRDSSVFAQYAQPVDRYGHGILGDRIEAGQLVVVVDGEFMDLTLNESFVFEDIRPRLADVDNDGNLEFVCIRTHVDKGAGIIIYKVIDNTLSEYAFVPEIGIRNRWLNIVAIDDLNNDNTIDLAWIQTPHIGGILKIAEISVNELIVLDEKSQYSNHRIGETNLCLSVITDQQGLKVFYVPSQGRNKIVGFSFSNDELIQEIEIEQTVDFSVPLKNQYNFIGVIEKEDNCID